MSFEPRDYLRHILDETTFLIDASQGLNFERYRADGLLQRAFVRSIEIIGEATKQLPEDFRAAHPEIEWSGMAKMRDRVIHGYFAISDQLVWEVVTEKIPVLHEQIEAILGNLPGIP
jgi:uncharacterized protein with HEPN domain